MKKQPNISKNSYVKLFTVKSNVKKAITLLKDGYSYTSIARIMGCHRTSIVAFHKKINQGVFYRDDPKEELPQEKINLGKNYKEYLRIYKIEVREIQAERMKEAEKTIIELRKWREENGVVEDDTWPF